MGQAAHGRRRRVLHKASSHAFCQQLLVINHLRRDPGEKPRPLAKARHLQTTKDQNISQLLPEEGFSTTNTLAGFSMWTRDTNGHFVSAYSFKIAYNKKNEVKNREI